MPRNRSILASLASILALTLSSAPLLAQDLQEQTVEAPQTPPRTPNSPDLEQQNDDGFFGLGWLDQTQAISSNKADALAQRIDRYFGVERSDLEAAYSSLRLITQTSWDHFDGADLRVSLRGTVHLPRLNERFRLVFSDDRGEGTTYYDQNNIISQQSSTRANLEVNLGKTNYSRFDFRVGLRSNLKLRSSVRWRYEHPFAEKYVCRKRCISSTALATARFRSCSSTARSPKTRCCAGPTNSARSRTSMATNGPARWSTPCSARTAAPSVTFCA
jgi:hypothetical protein